MTSGLRHAAEYALFRALETAVMSLPRRAALALGDGLGRLVYRLGPSRRRVARENLEVAFPGAPLEWRERTLEASFGHFARLAVEIVRLPRDVRKETWRSLADFRGLDHILEQHRAGRAAILVGGHLGNWELAAQAVAFAGIPLLAVARPINNPLVEAYFASVRAKSGQRVVPKHGGMRAVVSEARSAKGVLAILVDQDARRAGIFVDFFGRPASTTPTPALLAVRHGAAVLPFVTSHPPRDERYVFEVREGLLPRGDLPEDEAVRELTQRYTAAVEAGVREHPDQYLWMHRRWKTTTPPPNSNSNPDSKKLQL